MSDEELEPLTYAQTWTRGADGSFNDLRKERFATLLAGGKSIVEASDQTGIGYAAGKAWAKRPLLMARKKELRATPAVSQTFTVSIAMIVAELYTNATKAREDGQFKASNDALRSMYEISKAEKSLLETFDAKASGKGASDIVGALQAHLAKAKRLSSPEPEPVDAEGEDA